MHFLVLRDVSTIGFNLSFFFYWYDSHLPTRVSYCIMRKTYNAYGLHVGAYCYIVHAL